MSDSSSSIRHRQSAAASSPSALESEQQTDDSNNTAEDSSASSTTSSSFQGRPHISPALANYFRQKRAEMLEKYPDILVQFIQHKRSMEIVGDADYTSPDYQPLPNHPLPSTTFPLSARVDIIVILIICLFGAIFLYIDYNINVFHILLDQVKDMFNPGEIQYETKEQAADNIRQQLNS